MRIETKFEPGDKVILINNSVFHNSLPEVYIVEGVNVTVSAVETEYSEILRVVNYRLQPLDTRLGMISAVREDDLLLATKENIEQEFIKAISIIRDELLDELDMPSMTLEEYEKFIKDNPDCDTRNVIQ